MCVWGVCMHVVCVCVCRGVYVCGGWCTPCVCVVCVVCVWEVCMRVVCVCV